MLAQLRGYVVVVVVVVVVIATVIVIVVVVVVIIVTVIIVIVAVVVIVGVAVWGYDCCINCYKNNKKCFFVVGLLLFQWLFVVVSFLIPW